MKKIRMAVVGAGRLGGFHARKLAGMEAVELVGVADPVESQRRHVASSCGTRAVADHRELLGRVDAVVIAAPSRLHRELGLAFLESGAHVLMEKPLAVNGTEADELVRAAGRHRRVLQVGHVERFNPAMSEAKLHVRQPKYIEAVRASGFTFRSTDIGVVLDLMIHDLDLVLSMVEGEVRRVDALGLSVLGGHEDVASARLEFKCGCVASLSASRVNFEPVRRMSVWAANAHASIDFASRTSVVTRPSRTLLERRFDVDSLSPDEVDHLRNHLFEEHLPREQKQFDAVDALTLELEDFIESMLTGRSPRVSGRHGRDALALADLILARIRTHAWDGTPTGRIGAQGSPAPTAVPPPHWHLAPGHVPAPPAALEG